MDVKAIRIMQQELARLTALTAGQNTVQMSSDIQRQFSLQQDDGPTTVTEPHSSECTDDFCSTDDGFHSEDYEYEYDDDTDDEEEVDHEAETAMAKALTKAAFARRLSAPVLSRLMSAARDDEPARKRQRTQQAAATATPKAGVQVIHNPALSSRFAHMSASAPSLLQMGQIPTSHLAKEATDAAQQRKNGVVSPKPNDYLRSLLLSKGLEYKTFPAQKHASFFLQLTPEAIAAYDFHVVKNVRDEDVDSLRTKYEGGKSMQCSNKFGESLVHAVCRRGSVHVLHFLLHEARVSCKVCCDNGRTPLHDACWTARPNFTLIGMILDACPDLLYITDSRGFTPLDYVSTEHHKDWCRFLQVCSVDRLLAKELGTMQEKLAIVVG